MPDSSALTTYAELADLLGHLPLLLREGRRARQLSGRETARQIGCSFATVSRIEAGEDCVLSNAVAVLRWLNTTPTDAPEVIDA
jgi:transcriptional regulator with XRE-family HTH domain